MGLAKVKMRLKVSITILSSSIVSYNSKVTIFKKLTLSTIEYCRPKRAKINAFDPKGNYDSFENSALPPRRDLSDR